MRNFLVILAFVAAAFVAPAFATEHGGENPCGEHGQHCCTDDGGATYVGVEQECNSVCNDVAFALSCCQSAAAASCEQSCGEQTAQAVAAAVASCSETCVNSCSQPLCINARKKHRTISGVDYTVTICRETK
jgi:hypothetical protein